ncbi:MAG: transporter [Bacteroidia bacterium 44-10]|nr:MAG: transporter [Bacteroidia bacterium 44-10]
MNRFLSILLFILVAGITVQAQEKQWTLDACIRYAVENSPKVNKQNAQNAIYQQDYMSAIGRLIPSLNVGTNAYFNFGRGIDYDTNTYIDINSFSNAYSVYSSLTLFDGLSNIYRIRMQKANKLAGKQQLEQEREMVAYDTMESFFNVLYYKRMVQLAQEQAEESANNMKQAKRMEELGMKAKPDVAEMAAKEAADIYNLTRQKNLLTIGVILLKERMNFPIDEELDITDEESGVLIVKSGETVPAIYETARAVNPRALSAELAVKVQQMNKRVAMGGFSPVISMDAGISTGFARYLNGSDYEPFWDQLKNKRGSYVGFTLSVPLFTGFSKTTNYKRSKAQVIIAESEFQETLRTLYSEIEQAVADMNGQADAYQQAVKQREAMETAHEANQKKYEEGLISPLELHTSANRVVEAKAEELNAELQYRLKARLVRYYKGESFVEEGK